MTFDGPHSSLSQATEVGCCWWNKFSSNPFGGAKFQYFRTLENSTDFSVDTHKMRAIVTVQRSKFPSSSNEPMQGTRNASMDKRTPILDIWSVTHRATATCDYPELVFLWTREAKVEEPDGVDQLKGWHAAIAHQFVNWLAHQWTGLGAVVYFLYQ